MKASLLRAICILFCLAGLGLTLVPSILVFTDTLGIELHKDLMIGGAVLWFLFAPLWMKEKKKIP